VPGHAIREQEEEDRGLHHGLHLGGHSGYEKITAYSLEKKLKQINYFEHNYPEGYYDFFLWVAKNYGGLLWTYLDTRSDPN
jgi:hypothetical protein